MTEVVMTMVLFNGIVILLIGVILGVRAWLVGTGTATIDVDGAAPIQSPLGRKLHSVLLDAGIPVPNSCAGRGVCGLCRVRVTGTLDPPLATERAVLDEHALARNMRLACQVTVRGDLQVGLPEGLPAARTLEARVESTRHLTPLMKEIVLRLPEEAAFDVPAGGFVQVTCKPYSLRLGDLTVDGEFRAAWERLQVAELVAACASPTTRAYSLANHRGEQGVAMLVVRLALPPPGAPTDTPPGVVSSYLFSLREGDPVTVTGPFGHFGASDSDREMIFVAGGAGMAPMRAHIFEQLEVLATRRRISFWYGARSKEDLFYVEDFDRLQAEHDHFRWSVALSEPEPDDDWSGATGFIHQHLLDAYLGDHPAPDECEYYLCGPPLMIRAVVAMLERLGVPSSQIFYDDFGG